MFRMMKEEVPNYIIKLIPKSKQTIRTGATIYQVTAVEQIASSIIFTLNPKWLAQFR